jgi:Zn-dependent M16 (insulinase) family peptidase
MDYMVGETVGGFRLERAWEVGEIESFAHLFEHEQSGARLLYLKNTDDNKVFSAAFRTPSENSCGTAHILEHSVLCGSEKYPLKEPFVELIKSSMNTFLNAMTYPDKTIYPVASLNTQDLLNLADVYLDAVFNPLIMKKPAIFQQEGWHYHLEHELDPLTISGVVYSEMKGAYSSPMDMLENELLRSLYPDSSYHYDSGGDPDAIPKLSYEEFIGFYKKLYHPSNSYLYLYGDMDPEPFLKLLDSYLSAYERQDFDTLPKAQPDFAEPREAAAAYSVQEGEGKNGDYFAYAFRIGDAGDSMLSYELNVLDGILFDSDSSPLKKALMDADIADEIESEYMTGIRQPFYAIVAKNADPEKYGLFRTVVEDTLKSLADNGFDPLLVKSSLNSYEFDLREADSGNYPKGLIYFLDIMESWLYDCPPTSHLEFEKCLAMLRENENSQFYQDLIRKSFLENPNRSIVRMEPQQGLGAMKAQALEEELSSYKASLSPKETADLVASTLALLSAQAAPDSEEARNSIPSLRLSDVDANPAKPNFECRESAAGRVFSHSGNCRGIVYLDAYFACDLLSLEEISAMELLTKTLAVYGTQEHTEEELAKLLGIWLGGADSGMMSYPRLDAIDGFEARFVYSSKALLANEGKMYEIAEEILTSTYIGDPARLLKTVSEEISRYDQKLLSVAHSIAVMRIMAMETGRGAFSDAQSGFAYYAFLQKAKASLEKGEKSIPDLLSALLARVVRKGRVDALVACDASASEACIARAASFLARLPEAAEPLPAFAPPPHGKRNEAVTTPSNVNYVALGANYRMLGLEYSPKLAVARKFLSSGYLWDTVRVMGGAYGAMMVLDKAGFSVFVSYRDPKLKETLASYANVPNALREGELTDRDVEKLVISTISDIDAPKPVYSVGRAMLSDYYRRESWEERMQDRAEILKTEVGDVRAFASFFEKALSSSSVCVIGEERSIKANAGYFDEIIPGLKGSL